MYVYRYSKSYIHTYVWKIHDSDANNNNFHYFFAYTCTIVPVN